MTRKLLEILTSDPRTLLEDAAGLAAIFLMVTIALHMSAAI